MNMDERERFLRSLEDLTQEQIANREARCRFCEMELKEDALGIIKRDISKFVEEVRAPMYDDGRRRTERYRFCSEEHMRAWKSWENSSS